MSVPTNAQRQTYDALLDRLVRAAEDCDDERIERLATAFTEALWADGVVAGRAAALEGALTSEQLAQIDGHLSWCLHRHDNSDASGDIEALVSVLRRVSS